MVNEINHASCATYFLINTLNSLTSLLGYAFKLRKFTQQLESRVSKAPRIARTLLYGDHRED